MKSAALATPAIALATLQHLVHQARCFTRVARPFNRRSSWRPRPPPPPTRSFSAAPSSFWQHARTSRGRQRTRLFSSEADESGVVPITVLSGFLGSGKTTCLQHMLSNNEGLKIAVIVNDVASVNIDSKLVRGKIATSSGSPGGDGDAAAAAAAALPAGIVELQNGCACCSISGELLSSVSELMTISDMRQDDERFDHIVIEMSGVAEPRSVRNIFQEAAMYDMPLMERVRLDTMVTVVDCGTYGDYLRSKQLANVLESPELFYKDEEDRRRAEEEEEDGRMMGGMHPTLADILTGAGGEGGYEGGVCDLLVEQTEVADVVLLNKIDVLNGEAGETREIVAALNPRAKVIATSFGKVERLDEILAVSKGDGVAMDGVVDDHKDYVNAAEAQNCSDPDCADPLHAHDHSHSHDHSNSIDSSAGDSTGGTDPDCTDTSHGHSHSHSSESASSADDSAGCADPDCTDTSHGHSHGHSSESATHAGIGSYVYRARRPFHPSRLISILQLLPVVRGVPPDHTGDAGGVDESVREAFRRVLRSKGFAWTADSNVKALYWSHAGSSFEMQCLGRWWATLPRQQWPDEASDSILADFDSPDHDDAAASPATSTVGDRRQEVVFIGPGLGSIDSQGAVRSALDSCLLNDEEWDVFRSRRDDEASLACFENSLQTRMLTY